MRFLYFTLITFFIVNVTYSRNINTENIEDSIIIKWEWLNGSWGNTNTPSQMNFNIDYKQHVIVGKLFVYLPAPPPKMYTQTFIVYLDSNKIFSKAIGVNEKGEKIDYSISYSKDKIVFDYSYRYRRNGKDFSIYFRKTYSYLSKNKISTIEETSENGIKYTQYLIGEWIRK